MHTVHLKTESFDNIKWPLLCPRCGKHLEEEIDAELVNYHGKKRADPNLMREHWKTKGTKELIAMWVENDQVNWRPETFDVIREILIERKVDIPPQEERKVFLSSFGQVDVKRGLCNWITRRKPKSFMIRLCMRCARKAKRGQTLMNIGGWLALAVIISAIIPLHTYPSQRTNTAEGAAGVFFIGFIIIKIGESIRNRNTGLKVVRTSRNDWELRFLNSDIVSDFVQINENLNTEEKPTKP